MKIKEWEIFSSIKKLYVDEDDWLLINYLYVFLISFFLPFVSTALFVFVIIAKPINYIIEYCKIFFNYCIKQNIEKSIDGNLLEYQEKLVFKEISYGLIAINGNTEEQLMANKPTTLNEFIFKFLMYYNNICRTVDNDGTCITCYEGKRRSLGDIFLICRKYHPNCTIKEVLIILIKLAESGQIGCSRCSQINKYVFHTQSNTRNYDGEVEYNPFIKFKLLVDLYKNK